MLVGSFQVSGDRVIHIGSPEDVFDGLPTSVKGPKSCQGEVVELEEEAETLELYF